MHDGRRVRQALQILEKYADQNDGVGFVPGHDEVYIGHDIEPSKMSAEDAKALEDLDFKWDGGIPAWHGFV